MVVVTSVAFRIAYGPPILVDRSTSYPTTTDVLGSHARITLGTPFPARVRLTGEFVAVLVIEMDPEDGPGAAGLNETDMVTNSPGPRVRGNGSGGVGGGGSMNGASRLNENPAPITAMAVIVIEEVVGFRSVTD